MAINFIPNDPDVKHLPMAATVPTPDRAPGEVSFSVAGLPDENRYPATSTNFVAWQAREAALRSISTFEAIAGRLTGWNGRAGNRLLALVPNAGADLNAYYDRRSVQFFEAPVAGKVFLSGASADVVSHEVGHAILDALRPDLWNVHMMEIAAFHEGFGDCISIMTALSDPLTRQTVLARDPTLRKGNFVEATAEALSRAIGKAVSPSHNAAKPRRALNKFQWKFPDLLPLDGRPGVLINEAHSLGQLVSGVYYDLIVDLFHAGGEADEAALWMACETATRLLADAVAIAPVVPRFLQDFGRTMLLVDQDRFRGANGGHIRSAFKAHGIDAGGAATYLSPKTMISTHRPKLKGETFASLLPAAGRDILRALLGLPADAAFDVRSVVLGGRAVAEAVASRAIDLSGLSERLKDCKAYTPQTAFIGAVDGGAAVLGAVDSSMMLANEVRGYVRTLVKNDAIAFEAPPLAAAMAAAQARSKPTHHVIKRGDDMVLERVGFSCGCRLHSNPRCLPPEE